MMRPEQERVQNLLKDTVTTLCRNSLQYLRGMKVQGLLGITLDDEDVFVVHINEMFHNLGADGVLIQQADSVSQGEDINYNQCAPSSVTEDSPQRISAQPAVRTLSSTSPLGRNSSRRKARPSRAIGGLSSPSATLSTSDIYTEADCAQIAIKQESESIVVEDDLVDMSDSYNVLSSAEGDDEADVGLMKQSYMEESHKDRSMEEPNNNQTTATDLQATTPSGVTSSSANSITGQMRSEVDNSSFPQLVTFNPQFNAGGPFIAGVAPGFTDTSNASFQLQEVDGNTLIMGVPASTLGQVVDNYQEDWPTNNEELGLTSRGQPRKRRMWYRPRGAMSAPGPLGQMMMQSCQRPRHNLGSKQQKDALRVHLVQPLVANYLFDVVSLRVIWRINDRDQVEEAWRNIVLMRRQCDEVVSNIEGVSFFISSITGAFSKPHRGKYQDVTVYPAISYWIVSEKQTIDRDFNMVAISNGILYGLGNKNVIVKPINIPMGGKLGTNSQCLNAVDFLAPPLFVVMKDHTNYFTIKKVEHSADVCGQTGDAVARFVVVDSSRFQGFLQLAVDKMVHLLPGLRLVCMDRETKLRPRLMLKATSTTVNPDFT